MIHHVILGSFADPAVRCSSKGGRAVCAQITTKGKQKASHSRDVNSVVNLKVDWVC